MTLLLGFAAVNTGNNLLYLVLGFLLALIEMMSAKMRIFRAPEFLGTAFLLAVQWHPEWQAAGNPVSMALLGAFGAACAEYRNQKNR